MKQEAFEAAHLPLWNQLEAWLRGEPSMGTEEVPAAYRQLCHHLALARERRYGTPLNDRLQSLALSLHQRVYGSADGGLGLWRFLAYEFPHLVRLEWRLSLLACLLLFGTWIAAFLLVRHQPDLVYLAMSPAQAAELAQMYDPAAKTFQEMAGPTRDMAMFGHYIWNNIGIDFQNFASGLILGIGPVFILMFNGLHGGAAMAHLTNLGHVSTFYGFVSGHSSFELVGAALSGAAGLRLGLALLHPGRMKRLEALKHAGRRGIRLLLGAAFLTFLAAGVEGFWSANTWVSWKTKVALGITLWVLHLLYFLFAGRRRG